MQQALEPIALEFAGFWRRLGAYIIDGIILSVVPIILMPTGGLCFLGITGLDNTFHQWGYLTASWGPGQAFSFIISAAYFVGFWVWRGQTPGKMVLRIKVMRTDGSNLTLSTALLRYLGYLIAPFTFFIVFIWIAFDRHKQGLHDKMADTYVVKLPEPTITVPQASAGA